MARPIAHQPNILKNAAALIQQAVAGYDGVSAAEFKLQILEAVAARVGGFDVDWYWAHQSIRYVERSLIDRTAERLIEEFGRLNLHPAISLAAIATPDLAGLERRKSGSYFTDFRLAHYLASELDAERLKRLPLIDPACGSGILLVSSVLHLAAHDRKKAARFLGSQVFGIDKDPFAVRSAALALSSLTSDKKAISSLLNNLQVADTVLEANEIKALLFPMGFGAVITNPPWEKIKVTRHEYMSANGLSRHYGDDYSQSIDYDGFARELHETKQYRRIVSERYKFLSGKEIDLYCVFLELCLGLLSDDGQIAAIVPAGLIRSQSTERLRKYILENCAVLEISLFDNRAKFFDIDTRFKFLTIYGQKARTPKTSSIFFVYPDVSENAVTKTKGISFSRRALSRIRPDLSIPEVRSRAEWLLFQRITKSNSPLLKWGATLGMSFGREVDMTKDRPLFQRRASKGRIALIEGRMVHQFTSAAKSYVSGTGRRAKWIPHEGTSIVHPQFWIDREKLSPRVIERTRRRRVGFCDITGQTNERSMLTALVPENVVCGNKVPTIIFEADRDNGVIPLVFLSIANSFVFDWLLRRIFTTTVNYFILESIPFPEIDPRSPLAIRLAQLAERLSAGFVPYGHWEDAEVRAEIEALVLRAYGASLQDLSLMMDDFPLLDRGEPPVRGEPRSTITRDFTLLRCATLLGQQIENSDYLERRVSEAKAKGAIPFRPSHLIKRDIGQSTEAVADRD